MIKKISFLVFISSFIHATEQMRTTRNDPYALTYTSFSNISQHIDAIAADLYPKIANVNGHVHHLEHLFYEKCFADTEECKKSEFFLTKLTRQFDETYEQICNDIQFLKSNQQGGQDIQSFQAEHNQMNVLLQQSIMDIQDLKSDIQALKKQSILDQKKIQEQSALIEMLQNNFSIGINTIAKKLEKDLKNFEGLQENQDAILAGYKLDIDKIQSALKLQQSTMRKNSEDSTSKFLKFKSDHEQLMSDLRIKLKQLDDKLNKPKKTIANQTDKAISHSIMIQTESLLPPPIDLPVPEKLTQPPQNTPDSIISEKQETISMFFDGIKKSQELTDQLEVEIFQPLIKALPSDVIIISHTTLDLITRRKKTQPSFTLIQKMITFALDMPSYKQKMLTLIQEEPSEILGFSVGLKAKCFYETTINEGGWEKLDNILKSIILNIHFLVQVDSTLGVIGIVNTDSILENTFVMESIIFTLFESLNSKLEKTNKQADQIKFIDTLFTYKDFFADFLIHSLHAFSFSIYDSAVHLFHNISLVKINSAHKHVEFFKHLKSKISMIKMKVLFSNIDHKEDNDLALVLTLDSAIKNLVSLNGFIHFILKTLSEKDTPFRTEDSILLNFAIDLAQTHFDEVTCLNLFCIPLTSTTSFLPSVLEIFKIYKHLTLDNKIAKKIRGSGTQEEKNKLETLKKTERLMAKSN